MYKKRIKDKVYRITRQKNLNCNVQFLKRKRSLHKIFGHVCKSDDQKDIECIRKRRTSLKFIKGSNFFLFYLTIVSFTLSDRWVFELSTCVSRLRVSSKV